MEPAKLKWITLSSVALISSGGSVLIAVTALLLNYRGFASIDGRFASIDARFGSLDRRLELIHSDMRFLNQTMTALEIDVALLKDKAGRG